MKKLFVLFFTIATVYAAEAQNFGVRAGANLSNLSGDLTDDSRFNNKLGYHAGLTANFPIVQDFFSIQPELLYVNKGFKNNEENFERNGLQISREGSVNYNYLELPVLARINAGPLYFEGGPQASYLLGVRNNTNTRIAGAPAPGQDNNTTDGLTRFELGYAAGIGFGMPNGVSVGVRYTGSLNNIVKDNNSTYFEGDLRNARHSVFMFSLAYTLGNR